MRGRCWYLAAAVVVLVGIGFLQTGIDPLYPQFLPKGKIIDPHQPAYTNLMLQLPQQFLGLAVAGLREMAAGLLWVRADEFFHTGNYKAVMPLIRLTTLLDPKQLDVYSTGAWHLDYNFTDSEERSDRRYIPAAIALLKEGIANNKDNYDLYFELAWTHYKQKIKDMDKALEWATKAEKLPAIDPNTGRKVPHPAFIERMVAHMYEGAGRIDDADRQWRKTIAMHERAARRKHMDPDKDQDVVVARRNYNLFLLRRAWRKVDTKPPVDVGFDVQVKRIAPRVLLISGKANLVRASEYKNLVSEAVTHYWRDKPADELWRNGTRVDIFLTDLDLQPPDAGTAGYKIAELDRFNWEVDDKVTILVDSTQIREGKFETKIDMSKDPDIYAFKAKKYKLKLLIKPLEAPDFIQDRIGWHGEGMTDKRYLDRTSFPRQNVIRWEKVFDRRELI